LRLIRSLIGDPACCCRSRIARRLCQTWDWTQPDGAFKEAACRALLLQLELRGLILLPRRRGGALSQRRADRLRTQHPLPMDLGPAPPCAPPFHCPWRLAAGADALLYKDLLDFLVLPRVPHLASHLLAANTRLLAADWQARYAYAPVLLETFVDTTRFKGTCYKAANWIFAGLTQGRGKYDRHTRRPETVKAVFLYPLRPDFRRVLCRG
jgi:hypothetical protein